MENTKKIRKFFLVLIGLLILSISCTNKIVYYSVNANHHIISKPQGLKPVKENIYIDNDNNIYISGSYIKIVAGKNGEAIPKEEGIFLQDSIALDGQNTHKLLSLKNVIDINSYIVLDKNYLYKDKNNVYFNYNNTGQQSILPPFVITKLSPNKIEIFAGNFIKDDKTVYYYGNSMLLSLSNVDTQTFSTIKFENIEEKNKYLYLGKDKNCLYQNQYQLNKQDLLNIPIETKVKDSLSNIYFKITKPCLTP